jgi:hypothetical protein
VRFHHQAARTRLPPTVALARQTWVCYRMFPSVDSSEDPGRPVQAWKRNSARAGRQKSNICMSISAPKPILAEQRTRSTSASTTRSSAPASTTNSLPDRWSRNTEIGRIRVTRKAPDFRGFFKPVDASGRYAVTFRASGMCQLTYASQSAWILSDRCNLQLFPAVASARQDRRSKGRISFLRQLGRAEYGL